MIPGWPAVIAAYAVAAAFFTTIGWGLARRVMPRGMPPLAMAPALGWAVFMALALPVLGVTGFGWAAVTMVASAALAAAVVSGRAAATAPSTAMPRWTLAAAGLLALLPTMAIMPKASGGGILLGPPVFDHVKIAIVDAILRDGLPVPNPFYGPGGAGHLAYYYLWHFGAACLARALGLGGWAAEAAMTGFTAYAALMLVLGAVVALGGRALALGVGFALILAGTARPVLSAVGGAAWADAFIPRSSDLGGWLNQAAWVPQHLASACCLILAALLMLRLAEAGGWGVTLVLGVVAAAGFESSVWIGGVAFAVTACVLGAVLLARTERRAGFVLRAFFAAAVACVLAAPFIAADIAVVRSRGEGAGMVLEPYHVVGTGGPSAWRAALDAPLFWLLLLPIMLPAILPLSVHAAAHWRRAGAAHRRLGLVFLLTAAACLGVTWLVRSTIDNNDLGWRAALPAILLLTAVAAAECGRLVVAGRWRSVVAALGLAALAVPDAARMLREYWRGQLPGDAQDFAASQAQWQALRRHTGRLDRVANNPLFAGAATPWPVNIAWATLSDRSSCFSGWETMIAYGPLSRPQLIAANDLFTRVFAGAAAAGDIEKLARGFDCAAAVVARSDGAWARDPFAGSAAYGLAEAGEGFRVYVRRN